MPFATVVCQPGFDDRIAGEGEPTLRLYRLEDIHGEA
jgi:hypothetical protein